MSLWDHHGKACWGKRDTGKLTVWSPVEVLMVASEQCVQLLDIMFIEAMVKAYNDRTVLLMQGHRCVKAS